MVASRPIRVQQCRTNPICQSGELCGSRRLWSKLPTNWRGSRSRLQRYQEGRRCAGGDHARIRGLVSRDYGIRYVSGTQQPDTLRRNPRGVVLAGHTDFSELACCSSSVRRSTSSAAEKSYGDSSPGQPHCCATGGRVRRRDHTPTHPRTLTPSSAPVLVCVAYQ